MVSFWEEGGTVGVLSRWVGFGEGETVPSIVGFGVRVGSSVGGAASRGAGVARRSIGSAVVCSVQLSGVGAGVV